MSQAPFESGSGSSSNPVDFDAKLESEIEAALGDMSVGDILDMTEQAPSTSADRALKTGTVTSVHGRDVLVEFGPRSQGICPLDQFAEAPRVGEQLPFIVERFDQKEGLLILSRKGAVQKASWDALEVGQVVEGRCIGMIKGGLEVSIADHKAFLPASQVDVHFVKDISILLNEKVTCEITELDRRRGRLVVSRRKVLEVERERTRKEVVSALEVGRRMPAVITSIQDYGAFADIGGIDGLIHISDLSYERVKHPSEVVKDGQTVEVQILKLELDHEPPRIGLGMKQCLQDPFETKLNELSSGDTVSGKVTRIMPFGAFVEIAPGVEGLVHISELSHERVNRVTSVVQPDEVVTCQVLSVSPETRRISLSIKALKEAARSEDELSRKEDPILRKLKSQLAKNFGDNLKGGIG